MRMFDPHIHMTSRTTNGLSSNGDCRYRLYMLETGLLVADPRLMSVEEIPVAGRAGALPALVSSVSGTSAPWASTLRRPTARTSRRASWNFCRILLEKDGGAVGGDQLERSRRRPRQNT